MVRQRRRTSLGHRCQQHAGIGVIRCLEHIGDATGLDHLAVLHHADTIGVAAHDLQIVRDQQQRHSALGAQPRQQLQNLRLDGDVQRGGRFVGDQQRRIVGECHRDHDTLSLAARELMRERLQPVLGVGKAGLAEHIDHAFAQAVSRHTPMQRHRLGDLAADPMQRIEAVHRLLKHHAGQHAACAMQGVGIGTDHLLLVQQDTATGIVAA